MQSIHRVMIVMRCDALRACMHASLQLQQRTALPGTSQHCGIGGDGADADGPLHESFIQSLTHSLVSFHFDSHFSSGAAAAF